MRREVIGSNRLTRGRSERSSTPQMLPPTTTYLSVHAIGAVGDWEAARKDFTLILERLEGTEWVPWASLTAGTLKADGSITTERDKVTPRRNSTLTALVDRVNIQYRVRVRSEDGITLSAEVEELAVSPPISGGAIDKGQEIPKTLADNASSVAGSFSTNPTAGNNVIVGCSAWDSSQTAFGTGACTDNQSNTYTRQASQVNNDSKIALFTAENITSSGTVTVTVTGTSGDYFVLHAHEITGAETSSSVDTSNQNSGTSGGSPTTGTTGTTGTLSQANEYAFAIYGSEIDGGTGTFSTPTSWTEGAEENDFNNHALGWMGHFITSSTTALNPSSSITSNSGGIRWTAGIVTMKEAAAGGTIRRYTLPTLGVG